MPAKTAGISFATVERSYADELREAREDPRKIGFCVLSDVSAAG